VDLDVERKLFDAFFDNLDGTLRCVIVTDGTTLARTKKDAAIDYVKGLEAQSTDRRLFQGVKFFADDSFLGLGMQVVNPGYSDGHVGLWAVEPGRPMFEQWRPWWDAGFHIHVHTNGNAGNGATIEALAALQAQKPRFDHRFTCEHFGISTPEQARRLKSLGGLASINPYYLHDRAELNAPLVGADRSYTAARLKTLVDAGVPVSMHSDTPVGTPRPLEWVWIAVNRFGRSGTARGPGERVTPMQAFRMVTIDAAYTLGVEDKFGSIETGKFADFVVLEADPFEVPVEKLREVKVWGTVLGGKVLPASEIRP
jgi:predicted amidohydrolase YtcJ